MRKLITLTLAVLLVGLFAAVVYAANDPRCAGVQAPARGDDAPVQPGVDISGPCDEAEHANDPRCTGVGGAVVEDDHGGDRHDNSGPGSVNSGHGSGGDDDSDWDDHGGGDDSSGHGGGDD